MRGGDLKWDFQRHSCVSGHFASIWLQGAPPCQNSCLCGPQALQEIHRVKAGAPFFGRVEALGGTSRAPAVPAPGNGDFTSPCTLQCCKTLCFSMLWLPWLRVSAGSGLLVCSSALSPALRGAAETEAQTCTKQPGALMLETFYSWSTTAFSLSLCISSFMPIAVHNRKSGRHHCKNRNIFGSHFSKPAYNSL